MFWRILDFTSFVVGLDIQQKINVHYSGARSFRTQSPYYVSDDGSGLRPQMSDHQVKTQGTVSTAAADQGTTISLTSDEAEKWHTLYRT